MTDNHSAETTGITEWVCPSNIALVKYWGKRPVQLPENPSLSLTLSEASTKTRITYRFDPGKRGTDIRFSFEGRENPEFSRRVTAYIRFLSERVPVLRKTSLDIESENTFPHSAGIASSASAFGALALCLATLDERIRGIDPEEDFFRRASEMARLGSGSAARSVYGGFTLWGRCEEWEDSSDEYAIAVDQVHESFRGMRDSILIVNPHPKSVSSTAGHKLMETHPYASARFKQGRDNILKMRKILASGDWSGFIGILEEEALSLHALLFSGNPGILLMTPATLSIIRAVRDFRLDTGIPVGFTLDAGPNVHLLYDPRQESPVREWIRSELLGYCLNNQVIHDQLGCGPENLRP